MKNIDYLTKLNNYNYLVDNYDKYIKNNKNSKLIAIDFIRFKYINDNFGHEIGDKCLILFSNFVKQTFKNSILIRRSGDEFVIVTNLSDLEIENNLEIINNLIIEERKQCNIPIIFGFNCGVKECEKNLQKTLADADIVMYEAKRKHLNIEYCNIDILKKFKKDKDFVDYCERLYKSHKFKFVYKNVYENKKELYKELFVRDDNNKSITDTAQYDLLRINHFLKIMDINNLNYLFNNKNEFINKNKVMINIHYHTLLSREYDFIDVLRDLIVLNNIKSDNVLFSVNINYFDEDINLLSNVLLNVSELGIKICLDDCNYDSISIISQLIRKSNITYVKVSKDMWNLYENDEVDKALLDGIINFFNKANIIPIFKKIESKEEKKLVNKYHKVICDGYYYSKEYELN